MWTYLWSIFLRVYVWSQYNGFEILGSKSDLSNNQSRTTLWIRETCLILGLGSLIIVLITALLSSKTYNMALETTVRCVFDGMWSMFVGMTLVCLIGMELCMFGLVTANEFPMTLLGPSVLFDTERNTPIVKSLWVRAGIPSMHKTASTEMISASVELCETEVCFLHIQLTGTNVWLPNMLRIPADVKFKSLKFPAKSNSWNKPNLHRCAVSPTLQSWLCFYDECQITPAKRLSVLFKHAEACSQIRKYQFSQYETNTKISEQFVNKLYTILLLTQFLLL